MTNRINSSFLASPKNIVKNWLLVDVAGIAPGRAATQITNLLRGKHKPYYTPNHDCGDRVIVINADKMKIASSKLEKNIFYWHTNHPGGIKNRKWKDLGYGKILGNAIKRMFQKESPLARQQFGSYLKIYNGSDHPHAAQCPIPYDITLKPRGKFIDVCPYTGGNSPISIKNFDPSKKIIKSSNIIK